MWWDRKLLPGKTWTEVIEQQLDAARCVIVLWSRDSVASEWVKTEAREGKARGILIPILIEEAKIPLEFRHIQAADLIGWDPEAPRPDLNELLLELEQLLGKPKQRQQGLVPPRDATEAPAKRPKAFLAEVSDSLYKARKKLSGALEQAGAEVFPKGPDPLTTGGKRRLCLFLCHSSADKASVRGLYTRLSNDGVDPWLDEEDLLPSQRWEVEIPLAVKRSDVVLVCMSKASINKAGYVQKEIGFALDVAQEQPEGAIFLIPARLEECELPSRLRDYQWVNLYEEKGYERLIRALKTRASALGVLSELTRDT